MMNKVIINATVTPSTYFIKDGKRYILLDERRLAKEIPGFRDMTIKARKRHFEEWLDNETEIVCRASLDWMPNIRKKDAVPCQELPSAAQIFLSGTRMFGDPAAGYRIVADILCGQHISALRKEAPSFRAVISIISDSQETEALLIAAVQAAVARSKWSGKHCKLRRSAVLDYREPDSIFQRQIQDHSELRIRHKGKGKAKIPYPYIDTVALVIGANNKQAYEATTYLEDAAVILLNSGNMKDITPTKLPQSSTSLRKLEVVTRFQEARTEIASLLHWWWLCFTYEKRESIWAKQIVQKARASFGKPDSRYTSVELNPLKLRDAIRYQVFLNFLDELEQAKFLSAEELESYRQGARDVFDPVPPEPVPLRRAEDPEVFLEIMKELVQNSPAAIIAEGEPFVKKDKPMAAWRMISKEDYLVFEESSWAKLYSKTARTRKNIDISFFQEDKWEQRLQKRLCEEGIIKQPSSGSRYRYDLFGNGKRDDTYVVAIRAELLT